MISWWPGDGNADDIQGDNDGTLLDGATFRAGLVGRAFSFDGIGHASAPATGLPTGDGDRTLELWVKAIAFSNGEAFFAGYGDFGSSNQTYHLGTSGSSLFFSQWGQAILGPDLEAGRWYHVAVTNVGASVTLYLDGEPVVGGDLRLDTPRGTQLFIGGLPGDESKRLNGLIDEVGIYNLALSALEIQTIFLAGAGGKCRPASAAFGAMIPTVARTETRPTLVHAATPTPIADLHPWWDDAIFYEIFVRSFQDSDGNGIGDFNGILSRLDYLNDGDPDTPDDLGVTGLWLMPIHPSPTTHGYDVTDYRAVNPQYGTMDDFQRLLAEAHRRGMRVILDLVLNHTSSSHPWFLQSQDRQSPTGIGMCGRTPIRVTWAHGTRWSGILPPPGSTTACSGKGCRI